MLLTYPYLSLVPRPSHCSACDCLRNANEGRRLGSPWKECISNRERKRSQYTSRRTHAARFHGLSHQYSNHWATFTKQLPASCHSVYTVTVHIITPLPPYVYDLDTLLPCSLAFSVTAFSATICIYSTDRHFSISHFHLTISPHWLSFSLHVTTLFYQSYWCIDSRSSARLGSWHCGCPGEGWGDLWPWRRGRAGGWLCADGNTVAYVLKERTV